MAKDHDINIHIKAKGAEQTQEDLKAIGTEAEQMGRQANAAGRTGADGTEQLGQEAQKSAGFFDSLTGKIAAYAAGLFGVHKIIGLVTEAIRLQTRALQENAEIIRRQQESFLRLQFLGDFFRERPDARSEVAALAEFGRRPFEEVAGAWYNLRSKSVALPLDLQDKILREALEMGRTDLSMPLDTLVDMFTLYAKKTGQVDANRIQNVLMQTIKEAGGSGFDVAAYMPQFLPIGMAGGLTGAEAAGLWAWATTQTADAATATTGLRAVFMGLMGKETPQSEEVLSSLGVTSQMPFVDKINRLAAARASGALTLGTAEQLAGARGAALLLDMAAMPQAMVAAMRSVVGADRADIDLTAAKISEVYGGDAIARREEDARRLEIAIQNARAQDERALRYQVERREYELEMRRLGLPEALIHSLLWEADLGPALGFDAFGGGEPVRMRPDVRERAIRLGMYGNGPNGSVVNHYHQNTIIEAPEPQARPRAEDR